MQVVKFEAGKTYTTRSLCDYDCIISVTIASRTDKTVRTTEGKTFRPHVLDGVEYVKPWGSYSMCPMVGAND